MEQIHNIRNKFAHSFDASFDHPDVLKCVSKLSATKGQEVMAKNSYKFYESAADKCLDKIMDIFHKQESKNA